jgi:tungstate transport system ATP-binding protein
MTPLYALHDVGVRFGSGKGAVDALQGVQLRIAPGERVALVGSNGCGKSTLLRVLHGLLQPTAGRFEVPTAVRQAMVFQRPYLLRLSVQANIALGLWMQGLSWRRAKVRADMALQRVGLATHALRNARVLSGGQQQRVAMARAWALSPDVLFLDEPTASLDPRAKRDIELLMQDFARQDRPMTLVFASHNLGQVKRLASRVIYLEQGRILADLPVSEFFGGQVLQEQHPEAHLFVKGEST